MGLTDNKKKTEEDIGPVQEQKWFEKGLFEDGWQFGDLWKTLLGTEEDAKIGLGAGIAKIPELVVDAFATLAPYMEQAQWNMNGGDFAPLEVQQAHKQYNEQAKKDIAGFVEKDLYNGRDVAEAILSVTPTTAFRKNVLGIDPESMSFFGAKADSLAESTGQLLATFALQSVGIPAWLTIGTTAFGGEAQNAFQQGATYDQATLSAAISSGAEVLLEKLSGGIKFGGKALDDWLKPFLASNISNKTMQSVLKFASDATGEGLEEVFTNAISAIGQKITYDKDKNISLGELFFSEEAFDNFIGGAVLGGGSNIIGGIKSKAENTDSVTELRNDEKKVVDKLFNDAVEQKQKDGKKLSAVEKTKLYNEILDQLEEGDIDITDIEDALGEEVFKEYADTIKYEDDIIKQYDELGKKKNPTLAEMSMYDELKSQYNDIKENSQREELKKQMSEKVFERVKDTKLMNSYANEARRGETFQADVNEYDEAERATIQSAIDAGFLNNTNKTRRLINWIAKIAAKTGIKVDFTTNEKLKESGFAVDGKFVNGYRTKDGIGLNMQSKKVLETVVGHELTHIFEGTELYTEMQKILYDYADSKGELKTRRKAIEDLYKGVTEDIDSELTAELVGDYLFTDQEFINRLANDNRNLFQKIWDEVKYMCKQAHPSSPEAQKLEKLKRAFEEAYKASSKGVKSEGTKYSIGETTDGRFVAIVDNDILSNIDTTSWDKSKKAEARKAATESLKKFSGGIVVDGITRKVNKTSRKEYTRSRYTEGLYKKAPDIFADKMRAADVADDIVIAATNWNRDSGLKHQRDDNFVDFDHGETLIASGDAKYSADVVVGITDGGEAVFYDVVDMIPTTFEIKKEESSTAATTQNAIGNIHEDSADDIIPQKSDLSSGSAKNSAENDISAPDGTQLSLSTDTESRKQEQFAIIQESNPAPNSYNTWIRSVNDIKTLAETLQDSDYEGYDDFNPDLTRADIEKAIESGKITVYSSYPIKNGAFVTPSKMEAQSYSGNGQVYQNTVNIDNVAWIDPTQGQYAEVKGTQFSLSEDTTEATPRDVYFARVDEMFDKLKGGAANKYIKVDGYGFYINRNPVDESASITIKTPDGQKLNRIINSGNFWTNGKLWREAAKMVADFDYPNVATATSQEEAGGAFSEIEGKDEEVKKTFKEKVAEGVSNAKGIAKNASTLLVDKYQPIENLALKTGNRELDAKANSMRTAERAAQHYIGNGADGVRAINDLRQEVEASGLEGQFEEYMYDLLTVDRMSLEERAKPVIERLGKKFANLRLDQIKAIAKREITSNTTEKTAQSIRDAQEYLKAISTRNKPVRGDFYTADIARANATMLEQKYPQFKEWANDVYANTNYMLDKLVRDGELSKEAADRFSDLYPHYVPIRRANRDGKAIDVPLDANRTGVDAPIKGATGGDGTIGYLFKTLAMRAEQTYLAGAKNRFGIELKNTLKAKTTNTDVDVDDIFDSVETHEERLKAGENGASPTFAVFENGKRVEFEIPEDIYEALKPTPDMLKGTSSVLNAITKFQRGVLTEYNPFFMLRNAAKDFQDVIINSQHAKETYKNFPEAARQLIDYAKGADAKYAREYFESGAEDITYFNGKDKLFNSKDVENPWQEQKNSELKKAIGFVPAKISEASNFVERVPRLAEYIASRKSGASIDVAMLDAARVTTNFAAGGDLTKFLNRNGATFLNASVQGAAQAVRNVREAKANGLKGILTLGAKVVAAGLPFVLINALVWGDDEEYEELSDYIKENYYIVAKFGDGQFVRIPKGRMAAVIQNAFEQMGNLITGNDEVDLRRFGELLVENVAPNNPLENNVFAPIKNVLENKTWYGDDLVPQRLQDLPAGEQSDETTDLISKWLGETFNISPYKLNYLLDQYSGVFGDMFLPSLTPQAEGGNSSILGGAIAPLTDQFTTDSVMKNQNVSDFYDTLDDLTASAKSKYATDVDILRYKYMNTINSQLSNLYKQKRETQNSSLPNSAKYEAVRNIQRQIDLLAEQALNSYDSVRISGNTASVGGISYKKNKKGEWEKTSTTTTTSKFDADAEKLLDEFISKYKLPNVNWD